MLDKPSILVTGATGFIGRHLMPLLVNKYSNIYAFVRKTSKIDFLQKYGIRLRYGNLLDKSSVKESVKGVDIIIHLAALMSDKDYLSKDEFYKINALGTKNIIEQACGKIKQFIHISTVGVYGYTDEFGADESQPYGIRLSNYEYSKVEAEKAILCFASRNNFPFTILRLGQLYGPYMYYGWPDIIKRIEKRRLFIIGKGEKLLQLTYITDAVSGIMMTISNQKCINQIFNICADRPYRLKDIFYTIAQQLGRPHPKNIPFLPIYLLALSLEALPRNVKKASSLKYLDPHRLQFFNLHHAYSIAKARDYFGYNPQVELFSGMEKTLKWYFEYSKRGLQNE